MQPLSPTLPEPAVEALELAPDELLWAVDQLGGGWWPYPFRRAYWPAETEEETLAARRQAQRRLSDRGLLAGGASGELLATAARLVLGWTESLDLVYRSLGAGFVACACGDGAQAVLLVSREVAGAPLRVSWADPTRLADALFATVPECPPGVGQPRRVPARPELAVDRGAGQTFTRRTAADLQAVSAIIDSATGAGQAGACVRDRQRIVRSGRLVVWADGGRGRWAVAHTDHHGQRSAVLTPVDGRALAADLHTVLAETRSGTSEPGNSAPGSSTPGSSAPDDSEPGNREHKGAWA